MRRPARPLFFLLLLAAILAPPGPSATAREITDMAGRTVTVPDQIHRIHVLSHSLSLVTVLAPETLVALPFPFKHNPAADRFLPARFATLPQIDNGLEAVKALDADIVLGWPTPAFIRDRVPQFDRIGLPSVLVEVDRLQSYPATFRFLGQLLGRAERGEALASGLEDSMARLERIVATIPSDRRVRVYYAESIDGLTTQCDSSDRSDVIRRAGAVNAMVCVNPPTAADNTPIALETLIAADPDVIVTRFAETRPRILADPRWQTLRAVREGRVLAVPALPFNWFDRPPSFMRAIGAHWLTARLYPDLYSQDLAAETRAFFRLFFGIELTEADLATLIGAP
jgi:iron complex transport system substrate-binding protein